MIAFKFLEAAGVAMAILFLGYLLELARERGVLVQSLVIAFLVLLALSIGAGALWFQLMDVPAMAH